MLDRTMLEALQKVALGLNELLPQMVFVGGATVGLYADDPLAEPVRPTSDIDLSVSLAGYGQWSLLQERLNQLGFYPDAESRVICRFRYQGLTVDIMPDDAAILQFTNPWYRPGTAKAIPFQLSPQLTIRVLPLPYFLATKFEAFAGRGADARTSRDIEDIIYLANNCLNFTALVSTADAEVKAYLLHQFRQLYESPYRNEIIGSHLEDHDRLPVVLERIEQILQL